jgi:hypothetical protein
MSKLRSFWEQVVNKQPRPQTPTRPTGATQPSPAAPIAAPAQPAAPDANAVEGALGTPNVGRVVERPGSRLHAVGVGFEASEVVQDIEEMATEVEMATESFAAGIVGLIAGGLGTIISAIAEITEGDEFAQQGANAQQFIINFCTAFARTIRGEPAGGGNGSAPGARAANTVRARLSVQHPDLSALHQISMVRLYGIAWRKIQAPIRNQLFQAARHFYHDNEAYAHTWADAVVNHTASCPGGS